LIGLLPLKDGSAAGKVLFAAVEVGAFCASELFRNLGPRFDAALIAALPQKMDFLAYNSWGAISIPRVAKGSVNRGCFICGYSHLQAHCHHK
jgi:hypothetical protein